jgi:phage terminase large subunit-like protein
MKKAYGALVLLALVAILMGAAMFSLARAQRAIKFFESLKHTKGQFYGRQFTLLPWERQIIQDVYGTVNERGMRQYKYAYVEVPKKNGKSELAAGAALFQTFADGEQNGEVYGCAADRGQASIVFDVAVDMIDQLPALQKRAKIRASHKRITDKKTGTFYQVLSAEAFTKHGLNVSACVFDELHAQPNRDLWDVMTFGAGDARLQPIWWIITTAGDDPDRVSIGWEQHDYAVKLLAGEYVDTTWYPVIYGYEPEQNEKPGAIYDEALWQQTNPSLGHTITIDSVREAAEKAKQKPADERLFRWLRLNQWITTKLTTWLPLDLFDKTIGSWDRDELLGLDCYIGMDLSSNTDLTALATIFPPQGKQLEWRVFWDAFIPAASMAERVRKDHVPYDQWQKAGWLTVTDGDVVDYTKVKDRILEIKKFHNVKELCADRAFATMLIQVLEQSGLVCVDIPQTFMSLTNPLNETERLLRECKISHENNPVARWCFGNASVAKNGNGQMKLVKEHKGKSVVRTRRIDLVASWIDGMARATSYKGSVDLSAAILSDDWGM